MLLDARRRKGLSPLLFLVTLAMVLTMWQHLVGDSKRVSLPEYVCQMLGYPVMSAVTKVNEALHDTALSVFRAQSLAAENRRLRQMCKQLENETILLTEHFRENKAFREKLGLELDQEVKDIPALVIGRAPDSQRCRITIQALESREISKGDIVREAGGLVGRVIEVMKGNAAQVLLIVDAQHGLGARDQRSRVVGIVRPVQHWRGGWPDRLQMEKLRRRADILTGDVIITSGEDGIYPRSIPVGVVEAVTTSPAYAQTVVATIRPFVDFERLDYVWVVPTP